MSSVKIDNKQIILVACPKNLNQDQILNIKNLSQLQKNTKIKRYQSLLQSTLTKNLYVYQEDKEGWKATPKIKKIFKFSNKEKIHKIDDKNRPKKYIHTLKK